MVCSVQRFASGGHIGWLHVFMCIISIKSTLPSRRKMVRSVLRFTSGRGHIGLALLQAKISPRPSRKGKTSTRGTLSSGRCSFSLRSVRSHFRLYTTFLGVGPSTQMARDTSRTHDSTLAASCPTSFSSVCCCVALLCRPVRRPAFSACVPSA